jgi:hypothetical protein
MKQVIKARRSAFVRRSELVGRDLQKRDLEPDKASERAREWEKAEIDESWYLMPRRRLTPQR